MDTLSQLKPETTLVIVASKSFSTPETLKNHVSVQAWFDENMPIQAKDRHFVYVTSNEKAVDDFAGRKFMIDESIGGRFSVWSAVGLPLAIAIGKVKFESLLEGARRVDQLTTRMDSKQNPGLMLALLTVWNTNFLGAVSHVVTTYDHRLRSFTPFIQQLEMESLGKSTRLDGQQTNVHTIPVVWGGEETNGQHGWHQWLHQGTRSFSTDFIVSAPRDNRDFSRNWMLANCLAQRELLLTGNSHRDTEKFRHIDGGHGSTLIVLTELNAETLGTLVALYEHKVAYLGLLWGINAYDQWGVEHGGKLAEEFNGRLEEDESTDVLSPTGRLIKTMRSRREV